MTDNEIVKALECCCNRAKIVCQECPYNVNYTECMGLTMKHDALGLINRQKAEIERLQIENESLRMAGNSFKMHYNNARAEAIKEFAERMKKGLYIGCYESEYIHAYVDIIAEEIIGGSE